MPGVYSLNTKVLVPQYVKSCGMNIIFFLRRFEISRRVKKKTFRHTLPGRCHTIAQLSELCMSGPRSSTGVLTASSREQALEREVAELRRQLALISAQAAAPSFSLREPEASYAEAQYRALVEMTPLAVWITDAKGRSVYTNRYWYDYCGMTAEQASGWGWMQALHPDDAVRLRAEWVGRTAAYEAELRYRRGHDGQYRWHLCRTLPLRDGNGKITKGLGILVDIHDRKTAEAAIEEADQRTRLAVEGAQAGTWDYYPDTDTQVCSQRWYKIFQVPEDQRKQREVFFSRLHPKDAHRVREAIDRSMNPEIADEYDIDYRILWPSGEVRWIFARGKCFFQGEGAARKPVRFSGMAVDITERKQAEWERARLTAAVQHSPDLIGITDVDGNVLFLNRAGQKMVGLRDDADALSRTAFDFLAENEQRILREEILPTVLTGHVWEGEFTMRHFATGEPVRVETRVFGIFDEYGRLSSMANLSRDVSERKRLEERLHTAQKMEAVGRLAGGIAHDFNNLLTIISGAAEVLQARRAGHPADSDVVREISDASQRAASLTQQLLAFGKRQMVRPRPVDLNQAIRRMRGMLKRLVGEAVTLHTNLQEGLWSINIDPIQVDQILINLAANARDAMPRGGAVNVRTFNWQVPQAVSDPAGPRAGECVCLLFSDNGCGMDKETLSHVFEPFFTTKETGQGTGLGLSSVYGIVQQNGGEITARSAPGEGSTFTVYLPRSIETAGPEALAAEPAALAGSGNILLVEDEPSLRLLVAEYLREHGYQVHEAGNAQRALEVAQDASIDLLLTDVVMPGISGPQLAATLAASHPHLRVIIMSGYAEHASLRDSVLQKETLFLQKPFRLLAVLNKVHEALKAKP
jgi:two-component system, cell cycle sensor histidine kinase and response regulator CckA